MIRFACWILEATLWGIVPAVSLFAVEPPAKVLDLSLWKLTLPVSSQRAGIPDEIQQPELQSFQEPHTFFVDQKSQGVVFRAACGGNTTKGSKYPRCELREMTADPENRAAWSTDGPLVHTMHMQLAINRTPRVKQHVVCAQIHDAADDLLMIRLEGKKLFVERNESGDVLLDKNYKLGSPFELKIAAGRGEVDVWYQGDLKMNWKVSRSGCYFKAGCYTQSNPIKGDDADSYGEVVIYKLGLTNETRSN